MKHVKLYLSAMLFAALGITSCDDDWDTPPLAGPVATIEANTSIYDLKAKYWFDETNGVDTIGLTDEGEHIIIKGRVISSDASGNIYKNLVIQDETSAVTFSINQNSLYTDYRMGQEVVIDVTDMYLGKYAGLQQFGWPDFSDTYGWQTTFMPLEHFQAHAQLNGLPEPAKMDTICTSISALPTTKEGIIKMQSQLVRFDGVSFENGGKATFAEYQKTTSQTISDGTASLTVRTSGYANFYGKTLPEGEGAIVGILGYFNGSWQLTLRSYEDCIFGEPLEGSKTRPFTVASATANKGKNGWVKGYIVGAVAPGVSSVSSASDIEWAAPFTLPNTLVIADSPTEKDFNKCIAIELPQGSELRNRANLADSPDNLGQEITLKGTIGSLYGMNGLTDNQGTLAEFVFNAIVTVGEIDENFDSYSTKIDNLVANGWTYVSVKGNKDWYLREFSSNTYATVTGNKGTAPFDSWLITPCINVNKLAEKVLNFQTQVNGYGSTTSTFEVYVLDSNDPATANITKLDATMATAPSSGYSDWVSSGNIDLSAWAGKKIFIGWRYQATSDANYATWCVDNVLVGKKGAGPSSSNDGSEAKPYLAGDVLSGAAGTGVWVKGYIVGFSSGTNAATAAKFTAEGANATNVLIAESAAEKDVANCIAVALPSGDIRTAINLKENPANLGKEVTVKGTINAAVYGIKGVNALTDYKL